MAFFTSRAQHFGGKLRDIIYSSSRLHMPLQPEEQTNLNLPAIPELQGSWPDDARPELEAIQTHVAPTALLEPAGNNRLGVFRSSAREAWHRQVIASNASQWLFGDSNPFGLFPYGDLTSATELYINKKKLVPETQQCDAVLFDLVFDHSRRRDGVKDIAILAALNGSSHSAGCALLGNLREECMAAGASVRFLKCLIWSNWINRLLVRDDELHAAECLLQLATGHDLVSGVKRLFQILATATVNPSILTPPCIAFILRQITFETRFQEQLDALQAERRYKILHDSVSWLHMLVPLSETSTAKIVIKEVLPNWTAWTAWQPNPLRLELWEDARFSLDQRRQLYRIYDLEGPDTSGYERATLKNSPPACFQFVRVSNYDVDLLDRIVKLLDKVHEIAGRHAVELFVSQIVQRKGPITKDVVSRVETILATEDDDCVYATLMYLKNMSGMPGFNNRMVALTAILPVLDAHPGVQTILSGDVGADVMGVMEAAREEYIRQLSTGSGENLAIRIHDFGKAILTSVWLRPSLPRAFLQELQLLPSRETIDVVFNSLQTVRAPTDLIRQYLRIVIGGVEGDPERGAPALLESIENHNNFWGRGLDRDRINLALALENIPSIDIEVHEACRQQIIGEDYMLVRDLLPLMRVNDHRCCVELAKLLHRRHQMRDGIADCWLALLYSLLSDRSRGILEWSAEKLGANEWFQWVADLCVLFPDVEGRASARDIGFPPSKYVWWDLLEAKYRDAIDQLESLHRGRGNLRWLWFQELPEITILLDLLQTPAERWTPVESFIRSYLQPSAHVIGLICASLSAWRQASDTGKMAFASICTRYKESLSGNWPEPATEALMVSWERSEDISNNDRNGLRTLGELLGLGAYDGDDGLSIARQSLVSDYAKVLEMARELEATRRRPERDSSSGETARFCDAGVPDKLVGVVETVGERQWEVCFPMTHLGTRVKRAAGIDDSSRVLLVRVSCLRQQPSFCIHFCPNDESRGRNHGPWAVDAEQPDGRICWTKPSPLVYLLGRLLHSHLWQGNRDLGSIHHIVSSALDDPAAKCMVCSRAMGCKLWRPTVCSPSCNERLQLAPLEVKAAPLISDPQVLDFLLCCIYAASKQDSSESDLLPGLPFTREDLGRIIDSFPPLAPNARPSEILSQILVNKGDEMAGQREFLLTWMSVEFQGCLITAPQGSRVPHVSGTQFMVLNGSPGNEKIFAAHSARFSADASSVGEITLGEASIKHLWRTLTRGWSETSNSTARPLSVAGDEMNGVYQDMNLVAWANSAFTNRKVMLVCEAAGNVGQRHDLANEEGIVAVRYVLVCPKSFRVPEVTVVRDSVRRVLGGLKQGVLG